MDGSRNRNRRFAALLLAFLPLLSAPAAVRAQDLPIPSADSAQAGDEADRRCLTLAIAYEAGNEPLAGREAVAEVVLNRLAHPAFPKSVCGVVFQGWRRATGCQFTFTCDGALRRRLLPQTLAAARAVADAALSGRLPHRVPGALNYHADYVRPYWAPTLDRVAKLGAHIFYRPLQGGVPVSGKDRDWSQDEPDQELVARVLGLGEAVRYAAATPARQVGTPSGESKTFAPWGLTLVR